MVIKAQWGFLGLQTIGDETRDEIDQKIHGAYDTRMLNLADISELIMNRLDDGTLAQEELISEIYQHVGHILALLGNQVRLLFYEQAFQ